MKNDLIGLCCSFCKRRQNEVKKMIAGKSTGGVLTLICDACIKICYKALEESVTKDFRTGNSIPTPNEIYEKLCETVQGQEQAKRSLATLAYYHYKNIINSNNEIEIDKSCALIIGGTGVGKTLLAESLAKIVNVPVALIDSTRLTEAGYVGDDVDIAISKLYQEAKGDIGATQRGIIILDEIDKKKKTHNDSKDVSGASVQSSLLTIMRGAEVSIPINGGKKHINQETVTINTKNILFICIGAFEGLNKIVEKDLRGFNRFNDIDINPKETEKCEVKTYDEVMKNLNNEHLIKFGMLPEFLGRLPVKIICNSLSADDLLNILSKQKNSVLNQYKYSLTQEGCVLTWDEDALHVIVKECLKNKTGARGLHTIIQSILGDAMFTIPGNKKSTAIHINLEVALRNVKLNIKETEKKTEKKSKVENIKTPRKLLKPKTETINTQITQG
jgi:ATP-dependent Clp protease ATP-binding subunit ClpX